MSTNSKNKIKGYTTLEQAKFLVEHGVDTNSADMCYKCLGEDPYDLVMRPYSEWKEEYNGLLINGDADVIPCWSTEALLNLLPGEIKIGDDYRSVYTIDIRKDSEGYYQIAYGNPFGSSGSWHDMINTSQKKSLCEVADEMLCWLLKYYGYYIKKE